MSKTARLVLKIVGASLAFAACVCLIIGGWHDLSVGYSGLRNSWNRKFNENDDFDDDVDIF